MPTIHGNPLSPYVRKVIVLMTEKGLPFEVNPVFPLAPSAEFLALSPLGKIPAYQDGEYTLADSSCICAYLERSHPTPALYPQDAKDYGRALFFEEYGDTRLAVDALSPAFFQRIVRGKFLKQEPDEAAVGKALNEVVPKAFAWLEQQIGEREFLVGSRFSIADIAVASPFVNFSFAGERVDAATYPVLAGYVARMHARPSFKGLIEAGQAMLPK